MLCRSNPFKYNSYDGIDMDPFEVIFIKFKHSFKYMMHPTIMRAMHIESSMRGGASEPPISRTIDHQAAHDLAGKQV